MPSTVLIVDDTPANLSVLLQCLGDAGHRVLVAEDGEEALELTARTSPDLVLLDVMMPGIDGFETCQRLKADPATTHVPVIFMTALSDTAEKLRGFEAGAVDYITKPIQHDEALARVSTHLTLRRLQRQLADELALKQRFMRIASHDLRNPLCLASFATAIARRKITSPPAVEQQLQEIDAAVHQMGLIIDTFLELNPSADDKPVNLATLAAAVVQQHQGAAEAKQIALGFTSTVYANATATVRGSASLLYQILANFISNALKFSPLGAKVSVHLTSPSAAQIRLAVSDQGPGVPLAERDRLFCENVHLSPRPTAGETSHGYGLAIARQLAAQLGGSVGANFPAPGGSEFWVDLPTMSSPSGTR